MIKERKPKILVFDIETSPLIGTTWGIWEQNVSKVVQDWRILCFSYKWLGEKKTHSVALPDFKDRYKKDKLDDSSVSAILRELLDEADIVIAHNGDEFDIKKSNTRFILNGIQPPSPYLTIDTKKVAKKYFKFDSNSLKDLARYFGVKQKGDPGGIDTWIGCINGDTDSWKKMTKYCSLDVEVLEDIYYVFRPWMTNHPVIKSGNSLSCPKCSSLHLQSRGIQRTKVGTEYQRYQCQDCYGWSRSRKSDGNNSDVV